MIDQPCYLCAGHGGWHDHEVKESVLCPICRPMESKDHADRLLLPGIVSDWQHMPAKFHGPKFTIKPHMLIIHSAVIGQNPAKYFLDPIEKTKDGKPYWNKVSAHLSYCAPIGDYALSVPLNYVAWHAGHTATWRGQSRINYYSLSMELPGPIAAPRTQEQHDQVRSTVARLMELVPSLRSVQGHQDIKPTKPDPGPNFDWSCLEGLGLRCSHFTTVV